jgi:hypothetical protein
MYFIFPGGQCLALVVGGYSPPGQRDGREEHAGNDHYGAKYSVSSLHRDHLPLEVWKYHLLFLLYLKANKK